MGVSLNDTLLKFRFSDSRKEEENTVPSPGIHFSFSRSKYSHLLLSAFLRIYLLLDNKIDKKIYVNAILFLLVQNRQQTHD